MNKIITILTILFFALSVVADNIFEEINKIKTNITKYEGKKAEIQVRNDLINFLNKNPQAVIQLTYELLSANTGHDEVILPTVMAMAPQYAEKILQIVDSKNLMSENRFDMLINKLANNSTNHTILVYMNKNLKRKFDLKKVIAANGGGNITQKKVGIANPFPNFAVIQQVGGENSFDLKRYNK